MWRGDGSLRLLSRRPARQAWSRVPSMDTRGLLRAASELRIRALSLERSYSANVIHKGGNKVPDAY
jgi:hypothetical protein